MVDRHHEETTQNRRRTKKKTPSKGGGSGVKPTAPGKVPTAKKEKLQHTNKNDVPVITGHRGGRGLERRGKQGRG